MFLNKEEIVAKILSVPFLKVLKYTFLLLFIVWCYFFLSFLIKINRNSSSNKNKLTFKNFLVKSVEEGVFCDEYRLIPLKKQSFNAAISDLGVNINKDFKIRSKKDLGEYVLQVTKNSGISFKGFVPKLIQPNFYTIFDMKGKNLYLSSLQNVLITNVSKEFFFNNIKDRTCDMETEILTISNHKQLVDILHEIEVRLHIIIKHARNIFEYNVHREMKMKIIFITLKVKEVELLEKILKYSEKVGIFLLVEASEEMSEKLSSLFNCVIIGKGNINKWNSNSLHNKKDAILIKGEMEKRIILS